MAHGEGEDEGIVGEFGDVGGEGAVGMDDAEGGGILWRGGGEFGEPFGAGVDDGDVAVEGEENGGRGPGCSGRRRR